MRRLLAHLLRRDLAEIRRAMPYSFTPELAQAAIEQVLDEEADLYLSLGAEPANERRAA